MDSLKFQIFETVLAFALVVVLANRLKKWSIVREEDSAVFARLLTQAVLPATIFYQLITHPISARQIGLVGTMILTGVVSIIVSYLAGRLLRFDRPTIGALILTSTFGSSSLIGYPLVQFAFPNNPLALSDAVLISELGVGLPIFIFGPFVAMHFGGIVGKEASVWKLAGRYFRSPVFIAVAAGLIVSQLSLPLNHPFFSPFLEALRMIQGALAVISCLVLGLQLTLQPVRGLWLLLIVSALIQMIFQPWFAGAISGVFHFMP
jgi:predicted permease